MDGKTLRPAIQAAFTEAFHRFATKGTEPYLSPDNLNQLQRTVAGEDLGDEKISWAMKTYDTVGDKGLSLKGFLRLYE